MLNLKYKTVILGHGEYVVFKLKKKRKKKDLYSYKSLQLALAHYIHRYTDTHRRVIYVQECRSRAGRMFLRENRQLTTMNRYFEN